MDSELPLSPADLGLPPKFSAWRPNQGLGILRSLELETRFGGHGAPTGLGKSPMAIAHALISGERTAYLTSTKGLQGQLLTDFADCGLTDIRGRNNYRCHMSPEMTCEDGQDARCPMNRTAGCPYWLAYERAKAASLVVTNYSYWCAIHAYGEGLGQFGLLVLDEVHDCGDSVCNAVACEVTSREVYQMLGGEFPTPEENQEAWREWGRLQLPEAERRVKEIGEGIRNGNVTSHRLTLLRQWKALGRKLASLSGMLGPWIVEATKHGYRLDPLWPSQYAEKVLFLGIPRVVLYSATLRPKTMGLLGIPDKEMTFWEYPSSFPPANSPIIHIPTCYMDRHADAGTMALWMSRIDQVLAGRPDRKGIIHTVSYARRDFIVGHSRYGGRMLLHDSGNTQEVVERYRRSREAVVLVSPSLGTGYDFPGPDCEFQVIAKIPYPDERPALMQARKKADKEYIPYLTGQSLVQICGRGTRSERDRCENVIVDDYVRRFLGQYGHEIPEWWKRRYRRAQVVPQPPPALDGDWGGET